MPTFSLTKTTRAEAHTGSLLRAALDRHHIPHRVCGDGLERGYLATTLDSAPTIYITAHNHNGHMGYDLPQSGHIGFTAVVTTDAVTSMVWDGPGAALPPLQDAESCARAVAAHLDPFSFFCFSCEDTGMVELFDHSTDGLIGHRRCEDTLCIKRRQCRTAREATARARAAQFTLHECADSRCCPPF